MVLLRGSGDYAGVTYDLHSVNGTGVDHSGIPNADRLVEFAEAVIGADNERLVRTRQELQRMLGPAAMVDAAAVVAIFNAVVRIADATGIPLEAYKATLSEDFRDALGINDYPGAQS